MRDVWNIGLSAWIIQDGNYDDFKVGQLADFALEFYAEDGLEPALKPARRADCQGESQYRVNGEVIHNADGWSVLDVGVRVFREGEAPPHARVGSYVAGDIYIGIDPFFYMGNLKHSPGAPALTYSWTVEEILQQTAPFVPHTSTPRLFVRDPARIGWRAVSATNAWEDDDGHAEYILRCSLNDPEPRVP